MRGWEDRVRSYLEVRTLFNNNFRNQDRQTPISKSTVERTVRRFAEFGTISDLQRTGRPTSVATEEKQIEIAQAFIENPHLSLRRAGHEHDVSHECVRKILKSIHFHPYIPYIHHYIHLVQELNEDDPDHEATFTLNGEVNRHNCRYWSDSNPAWMLENHTQYPQKLNVWAGIFNGTLVGPFFIDGNLTAASYEQLLRDQIIQRIREIAGYDYDVTWFQQDGAAAHFGQNVRAYLDAQFPRRWIGRRGEIEWPARSPDLTPLDYFLWDYLKNKVYATKPNNIEELRN
ncbi:uncharacterized protein LOC131674347 [Phymastichus coffea]|uniref:uncharacterized protein LOC131674347 n=1 Tax=Phymastichus coffea TaxID=108790 RepID=UPI00273BD6D5|nr:uncharacterized protein LOC131674347 [Phymastichus coffea]